MINMNINDIKEISEEYGDAFYILDTEQFKKNYTDLLTALKKYYKNSKIAYSYKTNYIPALCKAVNEMGGYAEVVSDMESEIALRVGVSPNKIVYNGPYKKKESFNKLLDMGVHFNIDSFYEFEYIEEYARLNPDKNIKVGLRCNFDIYDNNISRFGFDVESKEFSNIIDRINEISNLKISGFHCHFATRSIKYWPNKVDGMLKVIDRFYDGKPEYICFGGGIFGNIEESLKEQFSDYIPCFDEYAEIIAKKMSDKYGKDGEVALFIEPGSALAGDVMKFAAKIINIKNIRGKNIATLAGSVYNINPTLNGKNPPIQILHTGDCEVNEYEDLDMGGYTCIESDYLYRDFFGKCAVGDFVLFGNVGSYSIVLKPPFILPNFPILELKDGHISEIKKQEEFDDIFRTYIF